MKNSSVWILGLVLIFCYATSGADRYRSKDRNNDRNEEEAVESMEEALHSLEFEGNLNDRAIGFKPKKNVTKSKYPFHPTPQPSWTENPRMIEKERQLGRNDIDDTDKDYFATYDFEFAKSALRHPNFQQKYLRYQEIVIAKANNKTVPDAPISEHQEPAKADSPIPVPAEQIIGKVRSLFSF